MKLVSNEKTEQNTVTLKFTIAKDVFDAQTEKVYNRKKNKITIQGFRPGKAPRHMIEKIYGKGVFYEDALNDLLPGEYAEALKESGIKAVASGQRDRSHRPSRKERGYGQYRLRRLCRRRCL